MVIFYSVLLVVMVIVVLVLIFIQINSVISLIRSKGVPYVPLKKRQLKNLKKILDLENKKSLKVLDLGSGDGRVLRMLADLGFTDLTGYEFNWWAHLKAKTINRIQKRLIKLHCVDFNKVDLSQYNIIFCYLMPSMLKSLREKFDRELKPGTKIYSYAFPIADWREPELITFFPDELGMTQIRIYTIE